MKTFIDFEKFITENPLDRHVIEAANENDPTLNKQLYPPHINIKEREDLERHQRETMVEKFKEPVFVEQVARKYSLKYYEALRDYNTRALGTYSLLPFILLMNPFQLSDLARQRAKLKQGKIYDFSHEGSSMM